ncbi:hypothetical protein ALC62_15669 [Cyphomyrmex costatus]|uniref:DNA-directed DNA polymerase n=1 Tax=Cyphomyrmex costatus TaxID=456900 RepID=A0A151I6K9_9HYME|nr:hypothetical protein ALC62_15669 [Cyphomyrmex costatus]
MRRSQFLFKILCKRHERDLIQQANQLSTREEYVAWEQRCDEFIESLEGQSRIKRPRLSIGNRQSVIARIARLESLKESVSGRFVHVGAKYGLRWREIETAFESRILTGAVINSNHIEPCRFLEDASEIVLERVQCIMQRYDSIKINTVFNGEFVAGDKRANKSIATRNYDIYRCTDQREWYVSRVVEPILASLEEFQERDSGDFTQDDWRQFNSATHCHVCEKPFLASSLDKLSSFLSKDKLPVLRREFSHLSEENFNLLTRKGVFPYEYIDCSEKLNELCLPPRESFYSSLTDDTVSESDYAHAVNVWQRFFIQTLGEYSDLYLKTDVFLLVDVFENFRDSCVGSYGLDPAYYYTLPGFTWDAMLKHTGVKFELLTDIDMVMFVERGIRGGLSQCSNRYARANNKYMPSYDSSKPSSYLMYYDVNNLYS